MNYKRADCSPALFFCTYGNALAFDALHCHIAAQVLAFGQRPDCSRPRRNGMVMAMEKGTLQFGRVARSRTLEVEWTDAAFEVAFRTRPAAPAFASTHRTELRDVRFVRSERMNRIVFFDMKESL